MLSCVLEYKNFQRGACAVIVEEIAKLGWVKAAYSLLDDLLTWWCVAAGNREGTTMNAPDLFS